MKKMIAYCGLDCEKCEAYLAAVNDDQALRVKTAELWSKLNHASITPEQINCLGCRAGGSENDLLRKPLLHSAVRPEKRGGDLLQLSGKEKVSCAGCDHFKSSRGAGKSESMNRSRQLSRFS